MSGLKCVSEEWLSSRSQWQGILSGYDLASPELVTLRGLRRRTDTKYVMAAATAFDLVAGVGSGYVVLPAGDELLARYSTLYFDTSGLDFFHDHRRGRRVRHKVRIRHYLDRTLSILEVKSRHSDVLTTKVVRPHEYGGDVLTTEDQRFVRTHAGTAQDVQPQAWTRFHRITLLARNHSERVTVDLGLTVGASDRHWSLSSLAIVEVKQWPLCRSTPVMSALRALGERPAWSSKYCTAIVCTRPATRHHLLRPGLAALERKAGKWTS